MLSWNDVTPLTTKPTNQPQNQPTGLPTKTESCNHLNILLSTDHKCQIFDSKKDEKKVQEKECVCGYERVMERERGGGDGRVDLWGRIEVKDKGELKKRREETDSEMFLL